MIATLALTLALAQAAPAIDFENGLGSWRALAEKASAVEAAPEGRAGKALRLETTRAAGLAAPAVPAGTFNRVGTVRFDLFYRGEAHVTLNVIFQEADAPRAVYRRRVVPKKQGWETVEIPLAAIAPDAGRLARWANVTQFAINVVGPGTVWLDNIRFETGTPLMPVSELAGLLFPGEPASATRVIERPQYWLILPASLPDPAPLQAEMERLLTVMGRELPLGTHQEPPTLVIFPDRASYQAFTPRYAQHFGRQASAPQSDGFTLLGIAMGVWDPNQGFRRPTFLHEFVHSVAERRLSLPNSGEWLQEGLASLYQLRFRPQAGLENAVRNWSASPANGTPLVTLLNGQPIGLPNYLQAAVVVDFLMRDPREATRFRSLLDRFAKAGSTDFRPVWRDVYDNDIEAFDTAWRAFCRNWSAPPLP